MTLKELAALVHEMRMAQLQYESTKKYADYKYKCNMERQVDRVIGRIAREGPQNRMCA